MVRWTERLPKNGAAEDQPSGGDLVRVFGGRSRIENRPWQPVQYWATKKRNRPSCRQAIPEIYRKLRHNDRISGRRGKHSGVSLVLTHAATADLKRIGRLEHEGAGYCRHRQVERDVEENGQEHSATTPHAPILPNGMTIAQ